MSNYSEICELFQTERFQNDYMKYIETDNQIGSFKDFIESISINKDYFRLEMSKKYGYKKKYKNSNIGDDTVAIKEVKSLLNKLSDKTYEKISSKIIDKLENKEYLKRMIIDTILEICIIHTDYIDMYLSLIKNIYTINNDTKQMIEYSLKDLYKNIKEMDMSAESEYLEFCKKNKQLDKLMGYNILVTQCELKKIIEGYIDNTILEFIDILKEKEEEEKYKCVQCLYMIFKYYYGDRHISKNHELKLKELVKNETINKIKFKLMDILDRR